MPYASIRPQRIFEIRELFSVHYFEYSSHYAFSG